MPSRPNFLVGLAFVVSLLLSAFHSTVCLADTSERETPLVRAVAQCRASVVNLRGRKSVQEKETPLNAELKHVNGMGTGVIIDPRGYILTNYHVVQDVKQIQVTTSERVKTIGRLIAHDPESDLALLKIDLPEPLPAIPIGTSTDLMLAESVAAVGNAYGYEHTVTVGIISQLNRTVQVNDNQVYRNLIQTDAPINPGNSGGPLLNLDGKMIGINVAVRIGAQGIAFAIPANDAMEIAARLMQQHVKDEIGTAHGMDVETVYFNNQPKIVVKNVLPDSPARKAGVAAGSQLLKIDGSPVHRSLDLHAAMVARAPNDVMSLEFIHDGKPQQVSLVLAKFTSERLNDDAWQMLGLKLQPATRDEMQDRHPNYQRGLKVLQVRERSPAETEGILPGDILVAMHGWKTETLDNLQYILDQSDIRNRRTFMFYILRAKEPFYGNMQIASQIR